MYCNVIMSEYRYLYKILQTWGWKNINTSCERLY